jgi:hypothetical protein
MLAAHFGGFFCTSATPVTKFYVIIFDRQAVT